jgi:WD40 repeat protein
VYIYVQIHLHMILISYIHVYMIYMCVCACVCVCVCVHTSYYMTCNMICIWNMEHDILQNQLPIKRTTCIDDSAEFGEFLAVGELKGHKGTINGCAWSPDGGKIVTAGADKTVMMWDAGVGYAHTHMIIIIRSSSVVYLQSTQWRLSPSPDKILIHYICRNDSLV